MPARARARGTGLVIKGALSEFEKRRLARLVQPLRLGTGTVTVRRDWQGRRRVTFSKDIPPRYHQVLRNIFGNLHRLS